MANKRKTRKKTPNSWKPKIPAGVPSTREDGKAPINPIGRERSYLKRMRRARTLGR